MLTQLFLVVKITTDLVVKMCKKTKNVLTAGSAYVHLSWDTQPNAYTLPGHNLTYQMLRKGFLFKLTSENLLFDNGGKPNS